MAVFQLRLNNRFNPFPGIKQTNKYILIRLRGLMFAGGRIIYQGRNGWGRRPIKVRARQWIAAVEASPAVGN